MIRNGYFGTKRAISPTELFKLPIDSVKEVELPTREEFEAMKHKRKIS